MINRSDHGETLSVTDAVALIAGIVIGAGIFKTPALVAANVDSGTAMVLVWVAGGLISLIGALCYAELASTYPNAGGDYHFLTRAYGDNVGFLFAWSRMTVIQTGSIAMLAFLVGDYLSEIVRVTGYSSSLYAGLTIATLTFLNVAGIESGRWVQKVLFAAILLGLLFIVWSGLSAGSPVLATDALSQANTETSLGTAMIFVLLTYGGWNEGAYLSAEVRNTQRNMSRVLLYSIGLVTAVYVSINVVFLKSLGIAGMAQSQTVAADLMRYSMGTRGAAFISLLVVMAALSTMNATIITGARSNYALGERFPLFGFLGKWNASAQTPVNALLVQGSIAMVLVLAGTRARSGFATMVEYTAPVFWFFFLLVGISLFVLRRKEPEAFRPFRVPFYPVTPILFCFSCLYMLQSSLAYTGKGALIGIVVLLAGMPLLPLRGYGRKDTVTLERSET